MLELSKYKRKLSHTVSPSKDLLLTYKSSNDGCYSNIDRYK